MQSHRLYHHLLLCKWLHRPGRTREAGSFQEQTHLLLEQLFRDRERVRNHHQSQAGLGSNGKSRPPQAPGKAATRPASVRAALCHGLPPGCVGHGALLHVVSVSPQPLPPQQAVKAALSQAAFSCCDPGIATNVKEVKEGDVAVIFRKQHMHTIES